MSQKYFLTALGFILLGSLLWWHSKDASHCMLMFIGLGFFIEGATVTIRDEIRKLK